MAGTAQAERADASTIFVSIGGEQWGAFVGAGTVGAFGHAICDVGVAAGVMGSARIVVNSHFSLEDGRKAMAGDDEAAK